MLKRIAVIDLGSNTFNLLIAEKLKHTINRLFSDRIPVKMGTGSYQNKQITPEAISRAIIAVEKFRKTAAQYNCEKIYAFATSAMRDANNSSELKTIIESLNITIEIIDGEKEAEYIYQGAKCSGVINNISLIMDIGGGSTEFIIADSQQIYWKKSYQLGIGRLYEMFKPSDPIQTHEIENIKKFILNNITDLIESFNIYKPIELIGTAGSFETFADILSGQNNTQLNSGKNYDSFNLVALSDLLQVLIKSDANFRNKIKGLPEFRRDLIVISSCMLELMLNCLNINKISYTNYALKEGVALQLLNKYN